MEKMRFSMCPRIFLTFPLVVILVLQEQNVQAQDICGKFNIGGPCLQLPRVTTTQSPEPTYENPYCQLVCGQGNSLMFGFACSCPGDESPTTTFGPTTTTMLATTTPPKEYCYYTASRPAQLPTSRKRLYNPSLIAQECQYPGVVGLFQSTNLSPVCNGILLEEDVILVAEFCLNHINTFDIHAHVTSYQASDASTSEPKVIASTATQLDSVGIYEELYTVQLDSPVTFDSQCAQPACVPNSQIVATDIDFNDCRLVGYGVTSNDIGDASTELSEILVTVDSASITEKELVVSRVDGDSGQACFNDDTAPLICSRKETGEWITVGATVSIGFPCDSPMFSQVRVANLLEEATIKLYYNALQKFRYAEPA